MPEVQCPRIGCGAPIPTTFRFEPEIGPLGQTLMRGREVVSQDALREHLRDFHKPKPRSKGALRRTI